MPWKFCHRPLDMVITWAQSYRPGGRFKNVYELSNIRTLKISISHKKHIFQCMGKMFCVEFQRFPLKFHTKYLTHTMKDADFIHRWKFMRSKVFLKCPSIQKLSGKLLYLHFQCPGDTTVLHPAIRVLLLQLRSCCFDEIMPCKYTVHITILCLSRINESSLICWIL